MGLSVKAEWTVAYTRSLPNSDASRSDTSQELRRAEREAPFSELAGNILGVFARDHRQAGARLRISALHLLQQTEPALAAAVSELASTGSIRVADAGTIELTSKGYDLIQRRALQARAHVSGQAPNA